MKIIDFIIDVFTGTKKAIQEEKDEIKELVITDIDKNEAAIITNIVTQVLSAHGVPTTPEQNQIINKCTAYAIRDIKEGMKVPSRLLCVRLVKNIKEEIEETKNNDKNN